MNYKEILDQQIKLLQDVQSKLSAHGRVVSVDTVDAVVVIAEEIRLIVETIAAN